MALSRTRLCRQKVSFVRQVRFKWCASNIFFYRFQRGFERDRDEYRLYYSCYIVIISISTPLSFYTQNHPYPGFKAPLPINCRPGFVKGSFAIT